MFDKTINLVRLQYNWNKNKIIQNWFFLLVYLSVKLKNHQFSLVSTLTYSGKLIKFQKTFFRKLSHFFLMFDSDVKISWKLSINFSYLILCDIELFFHKFLVENKYISFQAKWRKLRDSFPLTKFFFLLILSNET